MRGLNRNRDNVVCISTTRFLLTDGNHWESRRIIQTWSYRWASEVFHEFTKQVIGFESAQLRKEEAVKRHSRLSCIAQSIIHHQIVAGGGYIPTPYRSEVQTDVAGYRKCRHFDLIAEVDGRQQEEGGQGLVGNLVRLERDRLMHRTR